MLDYTKLRQKLNPEPDGQDVLRLRVGVVTAINANGTCDVTVSGTTVPNVSRLQEATVSVGAVVQMLSYRGAMMIIGRAASSSQNAGLGLWTRTQRTDITTVTSAGFSAVLTTDTVTFVKNRVYEVKTLAALSSNQTNSYMDLRPYRAGPATQLGEFFRFPLPVANVAFNGNGAGVYFTVANDTSGAIALYGQASTTGTFNHGATGAIRNLEVYDVGDISKYTGIATW